MARKSGARRAAVLPLKKFFSLFVLGPDFRKLLLSWT